ncbi:uncharacterized protein LOC132087916 [Daphnia carinata]|uniref:uncharacterized protein LOC132087916 n=1 Tax=Daphnia carinata TaxID=120202 RepID=UPI0028695C8C|nr:uncharacterized protein LOC132087916 [Daphnia carinata]
MEDKLREKIKKLREKYKKSETQSPVIRTALPLPTFNGEITAWKGWRAMWTAYDADPRQTEAEKFQYLRISLKGSNAETGEKIRDTEKQKSHYVNELKSLVAIRLGDSATIDQLRRIYDGLTNTRVALTSLEVDMGGYGEYIAGDVLKALPKALTSRWWRDKWFDEDQPTLEAILKELDREIRLREMEEGPVNQPQSPRREPQERGGRMTPCCFCQQNHIHHRCMVNTPQFRRTLCERENRCLKCLGRPHRTEHCVAKVPCRNCGSMDHSPALCLSRQRQYGPVRPQSPKRPNRSVTVDTNVNCAQATSIGLPTFTAVLQGKSNRRIKVLGLIDSGSEKTFIRQSLIRRLKADEEEEGEVKLNTFGSDQVESTVLKTYSIWMIPEKQGKIKIKATAIKYVAKATPKVRSKLVEILTEKGEKIADERHFKPDNKIEFDMIIACDYYWQILKHQTRKGPDDSVACASKLGWIIFGAPSAGNQKEVSANIVTQADGKRAMVDFKEFWALEHMGVTPQELEDPGFLKNYQETIKKDQTGRYEILFPFKNNRRSMESNKNIASIRLKGLLKKMKWEDRVAYHEVFQQYLEKGYIEVADKSYTGACTYLPHSPAIKTEAATTKIRPVFDGSVHQQSRPSLNDLLETGPNLNPELLSVLLRFRQNKIAWMADITQAFLQIGIQEEHGQIVRFLWIKDPREDNSEWIEYRWKRVPFGLSSSPFILRAVILKCLDEHKEDHPELVEQLGSQLYVDDWLGGVSSIPQAIDLITQAQRLFSSAKMELKKWTTNSKELRERLQTLQFQNNEKTMGDNTEKTVKALGVTWDPETDSFRFRPEKIVEEAEELNKRPTKRKLFSLALKVFDPMGLISPVTVVAKIIMQEVWIDKTGWDEPVSASIMPHWETFIKSFSELTNTKLGRWTGEIRSPRLHLFCDASDDAYSVAPYLETGEETKLLCSKTRIAPNPKKSVSTPRLELLSNLLAVRLGEYIERSLGRSFEKTLWTDSAIAYWWMKGESGRWKQFVHNRVTEIREKIDIESIRHCPGVQNPADIASRGASVSQLNQKSDWWVGPKWLNKKENWPKNPAQVELDCTAEIRKEERAKEITQCSVSIPKEKERYENYSSLRTIVRIWATVKRAVKRFKGQSNPETPLAEVSSGTSQ